MPTSKPTAPAFWPSLGCALALALTGCTTPSQLPRLRAMPDYPDAMRAAPDFTEAALKTIADLEARK
jgi:hypothetical protein